MEFYEWFPEQMIRVGYEQHNYEFEPTLTHFYFQDHSATHHFQVIYVSKSLTIPRLNDLFRASEYTYPLLFIVDSDLINQTSINEPWLRAIQALYYGRIYAWDGKGVGAVHHDKQSDSMSSDTQYVDVSKLSFEKVDCWYPGFNGVFHIARFDDKVFWKKQDTWGSKEQKTAYEDVRKQQSEYENFWKDNFNNWQYTNYSTAKDKPPPNNRDEFYREYYKRYANDNAKQSTEDVFRDFREAFERNKANYQRANYDYSIPNPRSAPTGDKWLTMLLAEGSLAGAKKKYRQLALEWHPDKKGDSPEVVQVMQAINSAWARAKEILV